MPVRTCVACRGTDEQERLLRFVADEAGRLRLDERRRAPGRGGYVHRQGPCLAEVLRKPGMLGRALKRNVVMTATVAEALRALVDEGARSGDGRVASGQVERLAGIRKGNEEA